MDKKQLEDCMHVADELEGYIFNNLFDATGLLMSSIDSRSDEPFKHAAITTQRVPRRAHHDPWSYWTYEDSVMGMGLLIDGLVLNHKVTSDDKCIDQAKAVWKQLRQVYYHSQVFGIGSFLRPYGGHDKMDTFAEPLGTDQATTMFSGVYRLMPYLANDARREAADIMVRTLKWYVDQGYRYWYYKCMIHDWAPPLHHAASYYLPALLFAHRHTGDVAYLRDFNHHMKRHLSGGDYTLAYAFRFGSELLVLRDMLGSAFDKWFDAAAIDRMWSETQQELAQFSDPGTWRRFFPESVNDEFHPYLRESYRGDVGMGFELFGWVHGGRARPRHEVSVLCALAALGRDGAADLALELLNLRKQVPWDFTPWNFEDHDELPHAVQLYASSVGIGMINSWRDAWLLAAVDAQKV